MIYFIACDAANAVKIGATAKRSWLTVDGSAFARLGSLQVGCPLELRLLAICDGDTQAEAELHQRFAGARLRGEWFTMTDELLAHIAQFHVPARQPRGWHSQRRNQRNTAALPVVQCEADCRLRNPAVARLSALVV